MRTIWAAMAAALALTASSAVGQAPIYFNPYQQQAIAMQAMQPAMVAYQPTPGGAQPAVAAAPTQADCTCGSACEPCCRDRCGCKCWRVFGEFLYLRPASSDLEFAVPMNGPIGPGVPIQVGRTAMLNPDYQPGYRLGIAGALDSCSNIGVTYTHFQGETNDAIDVTTQPFVLRAMVLHPSTPDAVADYLTAAGRLDIDFDLVDLDYRHTFLQNERSSMNYVFGARYGRLDQEFNSLFTGEITERVRSEVEFEGAGIRLGLEGERHAACSGLMLYGKTAASFVAGEFDADYHQGSEFQPTIVDTSWEAARIVTMLDFELGAGWVSCCGRVRLTGGYMVSSWLNVVKPADYIRGIQANDYAVLDSMTDNALTFDGFVTRAEFRW